MVEFAEIISFGKIGLMILGIIFLVWIIVSFKNLKVAKRVSKYSVRNSYVGANSLQDRIVRFLNKISDFFVKLFKKSFIINGIASRYKLYIESDDDLVKFVLVKFLVVVVLNGLYTLYAVNGYYDFSYLAFIIILVLGYISPDYVTVSVYRKRKEELNNDLFNALVVMNNAFKANLNIYKAIELVSKELNGPLKGEFAKVNSDLNKGLEIDVAFDRFYDRVRLEEVKHIAMTLVLVHKTGGNISDMFDGLMNNFNTKRKLRNELKLMSSTSLLIYQILLFIPPVLCLGIYYIDSTYFDPIYSVLGIIIVVIGLILYFSYIFVIDKIIRRVFND